MKSNLLVLAVGLLAGGALVLTFRAPTQPGTVPAEPPNAVETAVSTPEPQPARKPAPTPEPQLVKVVKPAAVVTVSAWDRLAEKYGPEKTATSGRISSNLTSLIKGGMELAQTAARNSGSSNLTQMATKELLKGTTRQLGLTDAQQQALTPYIESAVSQRMAAATDFVNALATEPEPIMEMMLAGDALTHQLISQAQFDQTTQPTRAKLQQLSDFLLGHADTNNPMALIDPAVADHLNAMLTPDQQTKLNQMLSTVVSQRIKGQNSPPFVNGQLPPMDLNQLDSTVGSLKQMADAAQQMMDAAQKLKTLKQGTGTTSP